MGRPWIRQVLPAAVLAAGLWACFGGAPAPLAASAQPTPTRFATLTVRPQHHLLEMSAGGASFVVMTERWPPRGLSSLVPLPPNRETWQQCLLSFWDARSATMRRSVLHHGRPDAVGMSPDGRLVACAVADSTHPDWVEPAKRSTIFVYEAYTGDLVRQFSMSGWVSCLAFTPDNRTLIAGVGPPRDSPSVSFDIGLRAWSLSSGRLVGALGGGMVWCVGGMHLSGDGTRAAIIGPSPDRAGLYPRSAWSVTMLDTATWRVLRVLRVPPGYHALSPDGRLLASVDYRRDPPEPNGVTTVTVWDTRRNQRVLWRRIHDDPAIGRRPDAWEFRNDWPVAFVSNRMLVVGQSCLDARLPHARLRPVVPATNRRCWQIGSDGLSLASVRGHPGVLEVWDLRARRRLRRWDNAPDYHNGIRCIRRGRALAVVWWADGDDVWRPTYIRRWE